MPRPVRNSRQRSLELFGLPAAGKSTLERQLIATEGFVSPDRLLGRLARSSTTSRRQRLAWRLNPRAMREHLHLSQVAGFVADHPTYTAAWLSALSTVDRSDRERLAGYVLRTFADHRTASTVAAPNERVVIAEGFHQRAFGILARGGASAQSLLSQPPTDTAVVFVSVPLDMARARALERPNRGNVGLTPAGSEALDAILEATPSPLLVVDGSKPPPEIAGSVARWFDQVSQP